MGRGWRITTAKEKNGLYYLKMAKENQFSLACASQINLLFMKFGFIIFVLGTTLSKLCFLDHLMVCMYSALLNL